MHVVDVLDDDRQPFAARYVAAAARQITAAVTPGMPVLLVAHSGAGPLLPQLAYARRAAREPVGGYVFLDAAVPRPGGTALPGWTCWLPKTPIWPRRGVPSSKPAGPCRTGRRQTSPRTSPTPANERRCWLRCVQDPLAYYAEPVPFPGDWPDAPCGFLRTSAAYEWSARVAVRRGWPVESIDAGHFPALAEPDRTAAALLELIARM